ncbi:DUF6161 domain-containing protein [Marinomonas polaris]|uniref:DUF6161 domain-containing protein n=1 Tax=Marinomonas polaris TaxID=293552 RepID=UPI0035164E28
MEHGLKYEEMDNGVINIESLTLPLLDNDGGIKFSSVQELGAFLKNEREAWQWLRENGHFRAIGVHYFTKVDQLFLQPLSQIVDAWEKSDISRIRSSQTALVEYLTKVYFPSHNRSINRFIEDQSKEMAISLLFILLCGRMDRSFGLGVQELRQLQVQLRGDVREQYELLEPYRLKATLLLEEFFKYGSVGKTDYIPNRILEIDKLRQDAESKFNQANEFAQEAADSFNSWFYDTQTYIENKQQEAEVRADNFSRRVARDVIRKNNKFRHDIEQKYKASIETVNQAEDTYRSRIEMKESVQYWEEKGSTHYKASKRWMVSLFVLVVALMFVPFLIHWIFSIPAQDVGKDPLPASIGTNGILASLGTTPLGVFSTILAVSLMSYLIRFCSKQYSTEHHLFLEAKERKVMLKTYLALMNENKLKELEDRKVALDTLFRPAQTGIFNDISHNVLPSDTIVKIFERQSSRSG